MTFLQFQTIRSIALGLAVVFGGGPLLAQAPRLYAPSTVYVHDAVAKTIRPLTGIIGSSYPGPVLLDGVEWASFALNHKSALIYRSGTLASVPDLSAPDVAANLGSYSSLNIPLPQQVLWAADSTRALVLASGSPSLLWLTQLDAAERVEASWDLDSSQTHWSLLAADSGLNQVLLVSQAGDSSQLWLVSRTQAPSRIAGFNRPTAAVIASVGATAFVADAGTHQILQINGLGGNPVIVSIVASEQYVADPVGLALSSDGSRLFEVDGKAQKVRVFQANTGVLSAELALQSAPVSLTPLSSNSFLLNGRTRKDQPFFFLDTQLDGRVFFAPAGQ